MRLFRSTALPLLVTLSPLPSSAFPFPIHFELDLNSLAGRSCANPCGYYQQVCCSASQVCYTDSNNQAACRDATVTQGGSGQWETYTTTYVQTDLKTVTSTGSRWVSAPTSNTNSQCKLTLGESACGSICCTASQECQSGVCVEAGGSPIATVPTPTGAVRPTSSGVTTISVTPTATVPFIPPVGTDGSSPIGPEPAHTGKSKLSGGAIAGIVIGVIAGVFLLLLLCLCVCAKGLLDTILGLLGIRRKKRRSNYGSYSSSSSTSYHETSWPGAAPPPRKKKEGLFGLGKWASLGLILGALAICLGLRRRSRRSEKTGSSYYASSYTYSDYSSSSSSSSSSPPRSHPPPRSHSHSRR